MPWETVTVTLRRWTAEADNAPYFSNAPDSEYVLAGYVEDDIWTASPNVTSDWTEI